LSSSGFCDRIFRRLSFLIKRVVNPDLVSYYWAKALIEIAKAQAQAENFASLLP
jgi:hypothetical protein